MTTSPSSTSAANPKTRLAAPAFEWPRFGLGSWHVYDRMHFEDTVTLLRTAVDHGVTLFDVGVYASEGSPPAFTDVLFAAAMRATGIPRPEYLLSVKLWTEGWDEHAGFLPQLERALFRLGAEHADLIILGDLRDPDLPLRDVVLDLACLEQKGLIRHWGVNNWAADRVQELLDTAEAENVAGPVMAQLKYSVSRRAIPDGDPFGRLWGQGLSLQASDVLEGGYLAGKTSTDRIVGRDPGNIRSRIISDVPRFSALAAELGCTPAQLAIAFTLTHPATANTLFGASTVPQLLTNLASTELLERLGASAIRAHVAPFWADQGLVPPAGP